MLLIGSAKLLAIYMMWSPAPLGGWALPGGNVFASNVPKPEGKSPAGLVRSWAPILPGRRLNVVGAGLGGMPRDLVGDCLIQSRHKVSAGTAGFSC